MKYEFNIDPVSKPRQTRADVWKKRPCVMRYRDFADKIRAKAKELGYHLGDVLSIEFTIKMPKSWSQKKMKKTLGLPHQQRPDIDNLAKAFMDAMAKEDSNVYLLHCTKNWGYEGNIIAYVGRKDLFFEQQYECIFEAGE